jgi:hypothetical protein
MIDLNAAVVQHQHKVAVAYQGHERPPSDPWHASSNLPLFKRRSGRTPCHQTFPTMISTAPACAGNFAAEPTASLQLCPATPLWSECPDWAAPTATTQ